MACRACCHLAPDKVGTETTRRIRSRIPEVRVLFVATKTDHAGVATEAGADGIMMEDCGRKELIQHLRTVAGRIQPA